MSEHQDLIDSLRFNRDCPSCSITFEDNDAIAAAKAIEKLEQQLSAEREAREKAEEKATQYDRWLTGGVYFTNDEYVKHCEEINTYKQRAESAEQQLREAQEQEQEPTYEIWDADGGWYGVTKERYKREPRDNRRIVYAAPIPPADVAELQRENAELTRKLAEQQATFLRYGKVNDTANLDKLLEEAKRQAVPEGWKAVPIEPDESMVEKMYQAALKNGDTTDVYEHPFKRNIRWDYKAMLSASPKPNGVDK